MSRLAAGRGGSGKGGVPSCEGRILRLRPAWRSTGTRLAAVVTPARPKGEATGSRECHPARGGPSPRCARPVSRAALHSRSIREFPVSRREERRPISFVKTDEHRTRPRGPLARRARRPRRALPRRHSSSPPRSPRALPVACARSARDRRRAPIGERAHRSSTVSRMTRSDADAVKDAFEGVVVVVYVVHSIAQGRRRGAKQGWTARGARRRQSSARWRRRTSRASCPPSTGSRRPL